MSFSKPKVENPCKKYIEFKGDKGIWQYYDKEAEEKKEFMCPFYFVVLDELSTIKGFSDRHQSGIYSNEVHSLTNEILRVKSFKGDVSIVGKYSEIKPEIVAAGGKFTKSVYALIFNEQFETELVNFQLSGVAFGAWMNVKFNQQMHCIKVDGEVEQGQKGSIKYKIPMFQRKALPEQIIPKAIEMDKILQDYLKQRAAEYIEKAVQEEHEGLQEYKTDAETFHETNYEQDKGTVYGSDGNAINDLRPEDDGLPF